MKFLAILYESYRTCFKDNKNRIWTNRHWGQDSHWPWAPWRVSSLPSPLPCHFKRIKNIFKSDHCQYYATCLAARFTPIQGLFNWQSLLFINIKEADYTPSILNPAYTVTRVTMYTFPFRLFSLAEGLFTDLSVYRTTGEVKATLVTMFTFLSPVVWPTLTVLWTAPLPEKTI